MLANTRLFASFRTTSRVGRPTTENRGVPGSSPGLAMRKPLEIETFSNSGRYLQVVHWATNRDLVAQWQLISAALAQIRA